MRLPDRANHLLAVALTSPPARLGAFLADFTATLYRAAKGAPHHPEERVVPPPESK